MNNSKKDKKIIDERKNLHERVQNLEEKNQKLKDELKNTQEKNQNFKKEIKEQLVQYDKKSQALKREILNELEEKKRIKQEENKKIYLKVFKILFSLSLVFSIVFFVYKMQTKSSLYVKPVQVKYNNSFVESWNKQVKNITIDKRFLLLSFPKNNENIQKLNSLLQNFYIAKITNSERYNDFLERNKFNKIIILNRRMNEEELLNNLKKVTKKTVLSSVIKKIIMMNSKKVWEKYINDEKDNK